MSIYIFLNRLLFTIEITEDFPEKSENNLLSNISLSDEVQSSKVKEKVSVILI